MNDVRSSGFTTVFIWSVHIDTAGNLSLNDTPIVTNGTYVGYSSWPGLISTLKKSPTSVNRIEVSIGAWGTSDFHDVQRIMNSKGLGPSTNLYKNFEVLKTVTGADAADFDDEDLYDSTTTVAFGEMLSSMGYKISLCPYRNVPYWQAVKSKLGNRVDAVWLQCYAGGAYNNPATWNAALGTKVYPGLWSNHGTNCQDGDSPSQVETQMAIWRSTSSVTGGFIWYYDDIQHCGPSTAAYATAVRHPLGG